MVHRLSGRKRLRGDHCIRRRLVELEDDILELELSVKIRALKSAWTAKYLFQLKPVSLERIDIVEAKLRDVEDELARTSMCLAEEKAKHKELVFLEALSNNVEKLNDKGQIIWNDDPHDDFALTSGRDGISVLVSGWYVLNMKVHLTPQTSGGKVELFSNGEQVQASYVPHAGGEWTSVALGCSVFFEKEDKLEVILTKAPLKVGADLTLLRVGE